MADLRIADAPEIDESEVQGGLKIPTGGFGNKAINMTTVASWVVKDKDLPSKGYVDDKFNQGNQGLAGHVANKNNPHEVTKGQIGLGNVDNTADADKPVSNATSAALNLKADKTQLQGLATTTQLDLKADKSATYTKTEVDGVVDDLYQSLEDNFVANGAALPYDPQVTYNDGAIVNDAGTLKKVVSGQLELAVKDTDVKVGDTTLDVALTKVGTKAIKFLSAAEVGLTRWVDYNKNPPYSAQEYEQAYNNGLRLADAIMQASSDGYSSAVLERGFYPFLYRNESGSTNFNNILAKGSVDLLGLDSFELDFNNSILFVLFDSNNKHQYNPSPVSYPPYQLAGSIITMNHCTSVTFKNGLLFGDQYKRSWVEGEDKTEQTFGIQSWRDNRNIRFENMKFTGFRGDGVNGKPRGFTLENYLMYEWSKGAIDSTGNLVDTVGAYSSALVDLSAKTIYRNMIQLEAHADRLLSFRNPLLQVSFFDNNNVLISQEKTGQSLDITLPKNCRYVQFTAYDDERTTDKVTYSSLSYGTALVSGSSKGFFFDERCEFYENMRGGVSNLGGKSIFFGSKFYDMGQLSKLGFPHYGDPTQYAINFEDIYTDSLSVSNITVSNVTQGVLSNSREFIVKDSKFIGMLFGGVNNYSCVNAVVDGNYFEGFRSQSLGAVALSTGSNQASSHAKITNNVTRDTSLVINVSQKPKMTVDFHNNTVENGRLQLRGNGKNLNATNNKVLNPIGSGLNVPFFYLDNLLIGGGNTLIGNPRATTNLFIESSQKSNAINFFEVTKELFLNNSESDTISKHFNNAELKATDLQYISLNTGTKGAITNDKFIISNVVFDLVVPRTRLLGLLDYRNTEIEFSECRFKNGGYFRLSKRESSASNTSIIFRDVTFDCDNLEQIVLNSYDILGNCSVLFLNCTFISSIAKTLPLIKAQGSATLNNITSQAIGCRFINVTNSDGITVDEDGNVIPFVPPTEPETPPTTP